MRGKKIEMSLASFSFQMRMICGKRANVVKKAAT
jgi:hypothetical protein